MIEEQPGLPRLPHHLQGDSLCRPRVNSHGMHGNPKKDEDGSDDQDQDDLDAAEMSNGDGKELPGVYVFV
jgi:hypothetical protein